MARLVMLAVMALVAAGCAEPVSTDVAVGPAASEKWDVIVGAVDALNDEVGEDVFTVGPATGDGHIDDHITMELVDYLGEKVAGQTRRNGRGEITVSILPRTNIVQVAHELGHAAGLGHVEDKDNFMYEAATKLGVSAEQREHLLGMMGSQ